jgi:hypothetical protein
MKTPQRRASSRHFSITPAARPEHFQYGRVVTEQRNHQTTIPWKMSVGRYLALGATLNEATADLFAKVISGNPLA